ncbi:hypothetical protein DM02DRAFT_519115 [Periconia macrospinosa]|uniref:Uncharacterized protein n=1 Tax=Periconia macrospinosa TaxID=97972 RepID=A0A2V1E104_9PLEO|nr:hypothetical protein DM02DRAFT_519115 [Periconia macrospinosa]
MNWGSSSDLAIDVYLFKSYSIGQATLISGCLANVPQLLLSFGYFILNNLCTVMANAEEWNNMSRTRKGLRVTDPKGDQRSTYFLQLPYRYSLPLMTTSSILHWLLSQSFFLVRIDYNKLDEVSIFETATCGFSLSSFYVTISVWFCLLCAVGVAGLKKLRIRMPVAASCSLAISAACHRDPSEVGVQFSKVQWGVMKFSVEEGVPHCSFSAQPVKKPKVGTRYL